MTGFMTLKFRRHSDENTGNSTAMTVRDRALLLINILLIFYFGNAGDEKRFQIVNGQLHIFKDTCISTSTPHILLR
jgi:hypothetical protein